MEEAVKQEMEEYMKSIWGRTDKLAEINLKTEQKREVVQEMLNNSISRQKLIGQ